MISIRCSTYGNMWQAKCLHPACNWYAISCSELYCQLLGSGHMVDCHPEAAACNCSLCHPPPHHAAAESPHRMVTMDDLLDEVAGEGEV